MHERDQVILSTFGFAYDDDFNRAVAVFVRYLSGLSPEHQKIWASKDLGSGFKLHPDYFRNTILGEWGTRISIFDAFIQELVIINEMANLMGKPPLFKNTFSPERPREFSFMLRPTLRELHSFCLLLDKMMSDNINKSFFAGDVPLESDQMRPDGKVVVTQHGTISLLETWLRKYFHPADKGELDLIFATFRKVRNLRQKPAHSVNEDEFDQNHFKFQRQLMNEAYNSVRFIRLAFANHPAVKRNPPTICDELRDGKIWDI
jgi:hypothetical protein